MAIQSELMSAINQICVDRGIDKTTLIKAIANAIDIAIKKEYGSEVQIEVDLDQEEGKIRVFTLKEVVKEVENDFMQISLTEAKKLIKDVKLKNKVRVELSTNIFGRIAAQAAKNVLLSGVREAERDAALSEIQDKKNTVISGKIQRMKGKTAVVEIGRAMALLPPEEQLPNEYYKLGERYKVLIVGTQIVNGNEEIIVSRSRDEFLLGLFDLEIPEISSESVVIKKCVREVGVRSKVAVYSDQDGIDPIGSCIGQKGSRITNIMNELGNEKVDVILWSDDDERLLINSFSPAKVKEIKVSKKKKEAIVEVDDDQLSLAIGRDGQNVRLVARLTGYKITVTSPAIKSKPLSDNHDVKELNKTTYEVREMLEKIETEKEPKDQSSEGNDNSTNKEEK